MAAAGVVWLTLATALTLQSALPWPGLLAVAALVWTAGTWAIRRHVLLLGVRAVRVVEWPAEAGDSYYVQLGQGPHLWRMPAVPAGCQYLGQAWFLRFRTPAGVVQALVDTAIQDPRAVRRLGRHLRALSTRVPGAVPASPPRQADTIAPKV